LPHNFDEKLMIIKQSYRWLKSRGIKGETECTTVTTQDQAISTNCFENIILKENIDSKCKQHETINHLTSGYSST